MKNLHTQSCGCFRTDCIAKRNSRRNRYDLSGSYGIGYTSKNEEYYFDLSDYELIKKYCWYKNDAGYVLSQPHKGKKCLRMSRLILNANDDIIVDHKNGIVCDNRRNNLRKATVSQNQQNRKKLSNNTSGTTGVSWSKDMKKWHSYIEINNERINIGYFDDIDNAIQERKKAEKNYFKEWSYDESRGNTNV